MPFSSETTRALNASILPLRSASAPKSGDLSLASWACHTEIAGNKASYTAIVARRSVANGALVCDTHPALREALPPHPSRASGSPVVPPSRLAASEKHRDQPP